MRGNGNGRPLQPPPIIGESRAIKRAIQLIERYAPTKLPILLVGATGTGKDLFAEHVHWRSGRPGRLLAVNCAALPRDTAESLLFGHRRGAFTGAVESRPGYFRLAQGRTLFLDELLSLPLESQAKLLRAVETGEIWPLGEGEPVQVDVRIVTAVQEDVATRLENGAFRRDLYRRLAGVVIGLPPLAERAEDILPLAGGFARRSGLMLDASSEQELLRHTWSENVRELQQVVERATQLAPDGVLTGAVMTEALQLGILAPQPAAQRIDEDPRLRARRREIFEVGTVNGWKPLPMAAALGLTLSGLYHRLRTLGLSLRALRKSSLCTERSVSTSGQRLLRRHLTIT